MADVFLSYRNTDERRKIVSRVATILRAHGVSVWWDYGLEAGESYRDQIAREMGAARLVIPFWCEESVKSQWVLMEAEMGREKLLPVRLQRVAPPGAFEAMHAAHLERWDGSLLDPAFDEFLNDVLRRLGLTSSLPADTRAELASLPRLVPLPAPKGQAGAPTQTGTRGLRVWMLAAGVLGALALGAGGWYLTGLGGAHRHTPVASVPDEAVIQPVPADSQAARREFVEPNDPLFKQQWYLGPASDGGTGILDHRRRTGADGSGVTIAVIDNGVFLDHEDLMGSPNILPGYDFVEDVDRAGDGDGRDPDPTDPGDKCGAAASDSLHGTFNLSLLAAKSGNSVGIAGAVPGAKVVPIRALGRCGGALADIADAIYWVALDPAVDAVATDLPPPVSSNVDILVLPMGVGISCPASFQAAIDQAVSRGILVIAAAGNSRRDIRDVAPAGCANVMTVAASDRLGAPTNYSNYGKRVALMAPGGDLTTDADKDGTPDGLVGVKFASDCLDPVTLASTQGVCKYSIVNGATSSAAILTAAAAALLWSQHRDETADQIRGRLTSAALPRDATVCSGKCADYPGAERVPGLDGVCRRPCGSGSLDLSRAD
jgi:hypothetical protein